MTKTALVMTGAMLLGMLFVAAGAADPQPRDVSARLEQLEQIITKQEKRIAELESALRGQTARQAQQEDMKAVAREMTADAAGRSGLPDWLDDLKFYGDLRLRYEGACYSTDQKDRHQGRFRLRFGAEKTYLDDQLGVGFQLASGSSNDPTSTNQTFDADFSEKNVWIDLAYASYAPKAVKGLKVVGGKMKNPFVHTDIVWDSDVNPEGVWGEYRFAAPGGFEPFAGVGVFQLAHNADDHDATLHAYSVGFRLKIAKDLQWTSAGTYYDFAHYEDNFSVAGGNTESAGRLAAEEFNVINVTNKVGWEALGLPMGVYIDYAHNCRDEVAGTSDALAVGYVLGQNKKKGDWSAGYSYKYIEADSTPGGFNDSTFGRSNRKGHVFSGTYNITDYMTGALTVYYTQPVSGTYTGDTATTVVADLIWKF